MLNLYVDFFYSNNSRKNSRKKQLNDSQNLYLSVVIKPITQFHDLVCGLGWYKRGEYKKQNSNIEPSN